MHKQFYFLSPVEVVKVTPQNMEEVAEWCGGRVTQVESKRKPGTMDKYVWVPTPKGAASNSAYPGMYVTKRMVVTVNSELKTTYSVFRKDYFDKNYFDTPNLAVDATWERAAREEREAVAKSPVAAAFQRAEERNIPKPAAPKVKKNTNEVDIKKYLAKDEDEELQKAVDEVEKQIPGAEVIAIELPPVSKFDEGEVWLYSAKCPACERVKMSNDSQEKANEMVVEHAKTCSRTLVSRSS